MSANISIGQAAEELNRKPGTIRKWERENILPADCVPVRDSRGRRFFTAEQLDKIRQWIKDTDRRPGKGLAYYSPSFDEVEEQVKKMRGSRK
jgi:hypothetical protein